MHTLSPRQQAQHYLPNPGGHLVKLLTQSEQKGIRLQGMTLKELCFDSVESILFYVALKGCLPEDEFKLMAKKIKMVSGGKINHQKALDELAMVLGYRNYGSARFCSPDGYYRTVICKPAMKA